MRAAPAFAAGLAALLAVLLAGCAVQLPDAYTPEKPGLAWEEPEGDLWLARRSHCIDCGGTTESATEHLTLLYRDGSVLHVVHGEGGQRQLEGYPAADGNRSGLTFAFPEHERFRAQVDAAWRAMTGAAPDLVRVHEVAAALVDPGERETVLRVVEHALRQTDDLAVAGTTGCSGDTCADGARSVAFFAWGRPQESAGERTQAGPAADRDAGWRLLERQVLALQAWLGVAQTT
jgi:hypothetical protein